MRLSLRNAVCIGLVPFAVASVGEARDLNPWEKVDLMAAGFSPPTPDRLPDTYVEGRPYWQPSPAAPKPASAKPAPPPAPEAYAADVSVLQPAAPAVPGPVGFASRGFTWTGCHAGVHVGGSLVSGKFAGQFSDTSIPASFGVPSTIALNNGPLGGDGFALLGGGQAGCDLQIGPRWAIGFDADVAGATKSDSEQNLRATLFDPVTLLPKTTVATTGTFTDTAHFIATATGRLGFVFVPGHLLYAKGGAAWVRSSYGYSGQSLLCPAGSNTEDCTAAKSLAASAFSFSSAAENRFGWTVGFGWELAVLNTWSVKLEYNYIDLGHRTVTFSGAAQGAGPVTGNLSQSINVLKFGANYLFR